jgi:hypothetical protein
MHMRRRIHAYEDTCIWQPGLPQSYAPDMCVYMYTCVRMYIHSIYMAFWICVCMYACSIFKAMHQHMPQNRQNVFCIDRMCSL